MTEKNKMVSIGGSVERALKGEYKIEVKAVLTEAWQHTLQSRMPINLALFFVVILGMYVSHVGSSFYGGIEVVMKDPELLQLLKIIVTIAVWPFIAGIEMMGVFNAVKKPTNAKMVFSFLHRGSWVAICALLSSVLISLGFLILIIPGVILAILLSLTIPLVVEKQLSPIQSITLSIKALRFKLIPLLSIYSLLLFALFTLIFPIALLIETPLAPLGFVASFFGLSFVAPWYYNVKGILYREIFGIYVTAEHVTETNSSNDIFSA